MAPFSAVDKALIAGTTPFTASGKQSACSGRASVDKLCVKPAATTPE